MPAGVAGVAGIRRVAVDGAGVPPLPEPRGFSPRDAAFLTSHSVWERRTRPCQASAWRSQGGLPSRAAWLQPARCCAGFRRDAAADSLRHVSEPAVTFILGCTGAGKSGLGLALAERLGGEILCVDSMTVYRRMDIGTDKPDAAARARVVHHLLDLVEPWEEFSVARFVAAADAAIADVSARGKPVIAVGGTALYVKALSEGLFEGPSADPAVRARLHDEATAAGWPALHERLRRVDPAAAGRIHVNDARRIVRALEVYELTGTPITDLQQQWDRQRQRYDCRFIGIRRATDALNRRINARVRRMIERGLVEEVRALLSMERPLSGTARRALGYAEVIEHLEGGVPLDEAVERIKINTRQFGKNQRTWFRRFRSTQWLDAEDDTSADALADAALAVTGDGGQA